MMLICMLWVLRGDVDSILPEVLFLVRQRLQSAETVDFINTATGLLADCFIYNSKLTTDILNSNGVLQETFSTWLENLNQIQSFVFLS